MRLQPNRNYVSNDDIQTPPELARRLVDHFQPTGRILEPCAGDGAFLKALRTHARSINASARDSNARSLSSQPNRVAQPIRDSATDSPCTTRVAWCEAKRHRDFFTWQHPVDWIITNPPWSQIRRFLQHALSLADHVVFLFTINHLWTRARLGDVKAACFGLKEIVLVDTPKTFPPSGFQLGAVHLHRGWTGPVMLTDWTSAPGATRFTSTSTPQLPREKSRAGPAQPGLDPLREELRALNRHLDTLLAEAR